MTSLYKPAVSSQKKKASPILFCLFVSVSYGLLLSSLPDITFKDHNNYLNYANDSNIILGRYVLEGGLSVVFNEPMWLLSNIFLNHFFDADTILRVIIFSSMATTSFLLLRNNPKNLIWICIFLFHPQVVKNGLIHIRQGLAISVFLLAWYSQAPNQRKILMLLTPLIHSSFFIILFVQFIQSVIRKFKFNPRLTVLIFGFVGGFAALLMTPISTALGARQGDQYSNQALDVTGLGFLLWLSIILIMLSSNKKYIDKYLFEVCLITFYLVSYWISPLSARIIESGLVLLLIAGLYLAGQRKYVFLGATLSFMLFFWLSRIDQPGLGFAGG